MKTYYVGLDVHKATIAIAVLETTSKLISQSVIATSTQAGAPARFIAQSVAGGDRNRKQMTTRNDFGAPVAQGHEADLL